MALVIDIKTGVKLDIPHELGMSGYRQLCVENVDTREGTIQECPLLD
ncbi:MAG: hypothetical protein GTO45_20455, partial [Candidatus Aminicenantes bacterium]|nr:hypothetical protein [Candidatus Aminicenantes bacterium]NIM82231.1 hypothetical protein [Candidatus Aminicenantes bacterium]NIN21633.1 hypothetical protein [Candidatus Aminicenantes bacterium]NIN44314.1 hypothetical protein [Candidatus Aminicenantes bacterium]NIN87133.1 hypothetical protein [Candidatus Aminicenantes bacterium]